VRRRDFAEEVLRVIKRVDHVAVAVKDMEEALTFYTQILGMKVVHREDVPEVGARTAFVACGDTQIELIAPLSGSGRMAEYMAERGEGLHHICLETDDIRADLRDLVRKGAEVVDPVPKVSEVDYYAFFHPKSAPGALYELSERLEKIG
jgi:methylmalonyl-CoA/ethylmalonyl-CoA epimerase